MKGKIGIVQWLSRSPVVSPSVLLDKRKVESGVLLNQRVLILNIF
jgi:hypothetical protein